jgi:hypothetical protein
VRTAHRGWVLYVRWKAILDGTLSAQRLDAHRAPSFHETGRRGRPGGTCVDISRDGAGHGWATFLDRCEQSCVPRRDACPLCRRPEVRGPPGRCHTHSQAHSSRYVRLRVGGYTAGPSKIAIKLASDVSSKPSATVLLSGVRTSPELAAFANGVMIRYLDFNDAFVSLTHGAGHPSDTIAALLPAAELTARSGRDLIGNRARLRGFLQDRGCL